MSEEKGIDRKNNIRFTELDSRDIKDVLYGGTRCAGKSCINKLSLVDVEYAFKLASTLRWRTWPEEKPKTRQVVVKRWHLGEFIIMAGTYSRKTLRNDFDGFICDFNDGDQWMYLSDLEVVR